MKVSCPPPPYRGLCRLPHPLGPGCFFKEASTIPFLRLPIATVFPKLQNMAYPFLHHRRKRMICDLDICLFMWHYFNNSAAKIYKRETQAK